MSSVQKLGVPVIFVTITACTLFIKIIEET